MLNRRQLFKWTGGLALGGLIGLPREEASQLVEAAYPIPSTLPQVLDEGTPLVPLEEYGLMSVTPSMHSVTIQVTERLHNRIDQEVLREIVKSARVRR